MSDKDAAEQIIEVVEVVVGLVSFILTCVVLTRFLQAVKTLKEILALMQAATGTQARKEVVETVPQEDFLSDKLNSFLNKINRSLW